MKTHTFLPLLIGCIASATPITYVATLSGPSENPPNMSPGTGMAEVIIDTTANTLFVDIITFSMLTAGTTASHIHCCTATPLTGTAGVATQTPSFVGFPLGVTSGSFSITLNMTLASSWNPAFITASGGTPAAAEAALAAGLAAGEAYLNIHTTNFPNGEIRGFLVPLATPAAVIPEPATLAVCGTLLIGLGALRRRPSYN